MNKHDKTTAWVEQDPVLGPFITQAFAEMATGKWTLKELADHLYSLGFRSRQGNRIAISVCSTIFHSRFYLGETWLREGDIPSKGNQKPLTDEATFTRVQVVLR